MREPISLTYMMPGELYGARPEDLEPFKAAGNDEVRQISRAAIRRFVEENSYYLTGRVLDFGAGKPGTCAVPQPYKDFVLGEYVPYDLGDVFPEVGAFDAILCTQVLSYIERFEETIQLFGGALTYGGALVMTYAVNWDEIETEMWRFTKLGVARMVQRAGLSVLTHERLAEVIIDRAIHLPLVNGIVCRK